MAGVKKIYSVFERKPDQLGACVKCTRQNENLKPALLQSEPKP